MTKVEARKYNSDGYRFIFFEGDFVVFQKEHYEKAKKIDENIFITSKIYYTVVRATKEDIKDGSLKIMFQKGLTRI